jgi:protein phosphatase
MSSTITAALIVEGTAYVANVGDSRTYLWSATGLRSLTKDHSLVQRLVDNGQIEPQAVYAHPQRNLIYQSMGDRPEVQPDTLRLALSADDRLILCSDGLWEMVRTEGLEEVLLAEPDPQRACDTLLHNANLAGGEDNISVIIVHARAQIPARQ